MPEGIIGLERTDSVSELAELYTAAHVFVNPTYEDNYPTTNLEALACGTPVITYNTGGSIEAVEESGNGVIVPQGNVNELSVVIQKINRGQEKKQCLYSCDANVNFEKYLMLYVDLL